MGVESVSEEGQNCILGGCCFGGFGGGCFGGVPGGGPGGGGWGGGVYTNFALVRARYPGGVQKQPICLIISAPRGGVKNTHFCTFLTHFAPPQNTVFYYHPGWPGDAPNSPTYV